MKRLMVFLLIVVTLAGLGYGAYAMGYLPAEITQVIAAAPAQGTQDKVQSAPQDVEAQTVAQPRVLADAKVVPLLRSDLSMAASGIALGVNVKEGNRVEEGDLLVKLDDAQQRVAVAQAQASLARAQASLDKIVAGARAESIAVAEAALKAAQANYDKLVNAAAPGSIATAEAALAKTQAEYARVTQGATEEMLIGARANLASAEAQLNQARSAYNRIKDMADAGMRPESLAMQQATIAYEAAQAQLNDMLNGPTAAEIASAAASVRQAQVALDTTKNALPSDVAIVAAQVAQAQAQLDEIKTGARSEDIAAAEADVAAATAALQQALVGLRNTELRAPFTGIIATLNVTEGEQVSPSAPVIQLADDTAWEIETSDLTELDIVGITQGKKVTLTFDALPDLELSGTVNRIRPIGQDNRGDTVYTVVVTPDKQDKRLLWNMTAVVDFGVK
jgi:HlyD family secretion protein